MLILRNLACAVSQLYYVTLTVYFVRPIHFNDGRLNNQNTSQYNAISSTTPKPADSKMIIQLNQLLPKTVKTVRCCFLAVKHLSKGSCRFITHTVCILGCSTMLLFIVSLFLLCGAFRCPNVRLWMT